ncbi:MAG: hypothetical protein HONBIEJF_02199 [Fimbriimonadaceae bacterium]|nr:hypothetical protein [Fimbriimonadaceae bacterium]
MSLGLVSCGTDVGPNDPIMTREDSERRESDKYTPEEAAAREQRQR